MNLPAYSIEIVYRIAPSAEVAVEGRLTRSQEGFYQISDRTGLVLAEAQSAPRVGTWVRCSGLWDGKRITRSHFVALTEPTTEFPSRGGEWTWFQDQQGRRARVIRRRAEIMRAIRQFFDARGFLEVETPILVPAPSIDAHIDEFEVNTGKHRRFLSSSPEYQMKRMLAGGFAQIYQFQRCFRRDEEGMQHQPEFTMLEWYRSFADATALMSDTEEMVAHVARSVYHGSTIIPVGVDPIDVAPPWERLTVDEAFRKYAHKKVDKILPNEDAFYQTMVDEVQPKLGRGRPTFLTHWPASMASLARLDPSNPARAERFEAYIEGVELCNGYTELVDANEQRKRFTFELGRRAELGKPAIPIDTRFQAALEEGLPPAGGNALGIDRLIMVVLGIRDIRDVVTFSNDRL